MKEKEAQKQRKLCKATIQASPEVSWPKEEG